MQRVHRMGWQLASLWVLACGLAHADGSKKVTYYYTDPQGTVLATTDEQGNVLTTADRRPFGEQAWVPRNLDQATRAMSMIRTLG